MTLLSIAQNTLKEIPGFEVPATIAGNENETAVLSLALINRAILETRRRSNWTQLTVRHTITTVALQDQYDLPGDWKKFIAGTWWDGTNHWPMQGPVSARDWEFLKGRLITSTVRRLFRIFKGTSDNDRKIYIFPTPPSSGEEITLEYISNGLVEDTSGTLKEIFTADDDTSLIDEDVVALGFKWRFLKSKGLPYVEEFRDYEVAVADLKGDNGGAILDLAGHGLHHGHRLGHGGHFLIQEGDFPG